MDLSNKFSDFFWKKLNAIRKDVRKYVDVPNYTADNDMLVMTADIKFDNSTRTR